MSEYIEPQGDLRNPWQKDLKSGDPFRRLRAYAHDVRTHEERWGETFEEDLDALLDLIAQLCAERNLPPYPDGLSRGGELEEDGT